MARKVTPANTSSGLHQVQFDYAWKWFCFHADQRIKMFNYMLIVFGIFAAGVVNALHNQVPKGAIAGLCFFAAALAVIFTRLDLRNRDLVWLGEDVLMDLERKTIFGDGNKIKGRYDREIDLGLLWRQALQEREWQRGFEQRRSPTQIAIGTYWHDVALGKHRVLLPGIGVLIGVLFLAAGIYLLSGGLAGLFIFTLGVLLLFFFSIWQRIPPPP